MALKVCNNCGGRRGEIETCWVCGGRGTSAMTEKRLAVAHLASRGMWALAQAASADDDEGRREWQAKALWYAAEARRVGDEEKNKVMQ